MMNIFPSHNEINRTRWNDIFLCLSNKEYNATTTVKCKTRRRRYWGIELIRNHRKEIPSSDRVYSLVLDLSKMMRFGGKLTEL